MVPAACVAGTSGDTITLDPGFVNYTAFAVGQEVTGAGIRPGAVSLPHGFGDPNVGTLLSGEVGVDPLSGMVMLGAVPALVESAS